MKFLNFFILTFNHSYSPKAYVRSFLYSVVVIFALAFMLHISNMNLNGNDLIKEFQMQKIASEKFHDVSTLIVGDSSAGNALDAKYFSELSEQKSSNLSLTGSWGIVGSLGMIQNSIKKNPHIQNIIIIQTPDIWGRSFAKESILELYTFQDMYKYLSLSTIISYFFNPAEIWWHLKYKILSLKHQSSIDPQNDYVLQKKKKILQWPSHTRCSRIVQRHTNKR